MKTLKFILLAILSASLGAVIFFLFLKSKPEFAASLLNSKARRQSIQDQVDSIVRDQDKVFRNFDTVFGDDFFRQSDPFEEMRKFRKQLGRQFRPKNDTALFSPFDSWFEDKFGGGSVEDIVMREDDGNVYYDIKLAGVDGSSVKANAENGYLTIAGEVKKSKDTGREGENHSFYQSSFRRTFPLPRNVIAEKMEMTPGKNVLILKFPKRKK